MSVAGLYIKYNIGDVVYKSSETKITKQHKCPDCLDSKKWDAVSPAGTEYKFSCPRCSGGYSGFDVSLKYSEYTPLVSKLTIGSIRLDTHNKTDPVEYMCIETGVGSGTIHYQKTLFSTEQEALDDSLFRCRELNEKCVYQSEHYKSSLSISDYQLFPADDFVREKKAREYVDRLRWFIDDVRSAFDFEDVQKAIEKLDKEDSE